MPIRKRKSKLAVKPVKKRIKAKKHVRSRGSAPSSLSKDKGRVVKSAVKKKKSVAIKTELAKEKPKAKTKKELVAEYEQLIAEEKHYYDNIVGDALPEDHEYSAKDYRWKELYKHDDKHDAEPLINGGKMYRSLDPVIKFAGYDVNYVTDPVSKRPLKRVKTYDIYASDIEWMYKADRRKWFKDLENGTAKDAKVLEKCLKEGVLPVEYFSVYNEDKAVILTSFGAKGTEPCNPHHRE